MIVNSFEFFWLFPIIFTIYLVVLAMKRGEAGRLANLVLLVVSYGLFFYYNKVMTVVLLGVTLVTWGGALLVGRYHRKAVVASSVVLGLLPLLAFKYYGFLSANLNSLFAWFGSSAALPGMNLAIPLGISFFTFQAVGYFIDVAKHRIEPERNLGDYMLFVAFFPQIAAGPISKAADLLPQIKSRRPFDGGRATRGLRWLLWGMFMKVVVADNIGESITDPLLHSAAYTSWTVIKAVVLYSMQIYCDFAGYSFMAIGIGELLGFELINNFERPYLSGSITEFWRRWHRSLSIWLRDYVYIPLGGSRCGKLRNYFNITATFLVSGLWHGANWTFVAWGGSHGVVQVVEKHLGMQKRPSRWFILTGRILLTFVFVTLAWVFFVHPTFKGATDTIGAMFVSKGQKTVTMTLAAVLAAIVIVKDIADEYSIRWLQPLESKSTAVRWTAYAVLMASIMILSVYGEKFIYAGF